MVLSEKLVMLRKQNGFSQEELAEKLKIARQTVSKWETGLAIPELDGLISLSRLYGIPIDRIVKNDDDCNLKLSPAPEVNRADWISFLIRAKRNCYAGHGAEVEPSRPKSHDLKYAEKNLLYYRYLYRWRKICRRRSALAGRNPCLVNELLRKSNR